MAIITSAVVGGIAGIGKFLLSAHMSNRKMELEMLAERNKFSVASRTAAASITDNRVAFTRRVIAIMLVSTLCLPVWMSLINPDLSITIPQNMLEMSFWDYILPWREPQEVTKYITVKAPILAMPIYDLAAMAVGFYFGSGGSRTR